jgi:Na+/H+-dicarboxylate symporter
MKHLLPLANKKPPFALTHKILIGMLAGVIVGSILFYCPDWPRVDAIVVEGILAIGGEIFFATMQMLVVPIVLVSLVCGVSHLKDIRQLGAVGLKTLALYLCTTAIAITLGLCFANLFHIGDGMLALSEQVFQIEKPPSLRETLVNIFPTNPFQALAEGNMLQIIVFALLLGTAITRLRERGHRIATLFNELNEVVMTLITMLIKVAPYGVFCILAHTFARYGLALVDDLLGYFFTVLLVLIIHVVITNSLLLKFLGNLNPWCFFHKMYTAMLFAFSTSSSNVSIPVTLETAEHKLGVNNSIASFVIPLGATINMDGTAIMQGVATVFIANVYGIDITLSGYITIVLMAVLASIGTAGVPGVGLITLAMVLDQMGIPINGIGLILGIDRFLDMVRTAVNITGDCAVACVVGKSENQMDVETFRE